MKPRSAVIIVSSVMLIGCAYFYNTANNDYETTWANVLERPSIAAGCSSNAPGDTLVSQFCVDKALDFNSPSGRLFSPAQVTTFNQAYARMNADNREMADSFYLAVFLAVVLVFALIATAIKEEHRLRITRETVIRVGR